MGAGDTDGPRDDPLARDVEAFVAPLASTPSAADPTHADRSVTSGFAGRRAGLVVAGLAVAAVAAVLAVVLGSSGGAPLSPVAVGEAIVLRSADLPGFRFSPTIHVRAPAGGLSNYPGAQCLGSDANGAKNSVLVMSVAVAHSGDTQVEDVISIVTVKPSVAAVARDFTVFESRGLPGCVSRVEQAEFQAEFATSGGNVNVGAVHATFLPFRAPGSDASFGWRVSAVVRDAGRLINVYVDLRGFAIGRDEVMLETVSLPNPFPPDTARRLSSLLLARALAQPR